MAGQNGRHSFENLEKGVFIGTGKYNIPIIHQSDVLDIAWLPFNYFNRTSVQERYGLHFFIDDYQFKRVWHFPNKYIAPLQKFGCVCSPDFSLYADMPFALQLYNHYRKHWLAAYWQQAGITVIPSISWSDKESFDFCFDGEPTHSTVAVSSVGAAKDNQSKMRFITGLDEMIYRLEPSQILFFGQVPTECSHYDRIVPVGTFYDKFKKGST